MAPIRVWVITGCNTGLGLALALHVASQGDKVIGTVRSLSKFPEQLRELGVSPLVVDFSGSDEEVKKAGEEALKTYDGVDVLVNNAGYGVVGPIEELQVSDVRAQFQTNFFGLVAFTQPFVTHFRTRRAGQILNVSSVAGTVALPAWGAYCSSKAALDMLTDTLHYELKLFGVRVLSIKPGLFRTSFLSRLPTYSPRTDDSPLDTSGSQAQLSEVYTDTKTQGYDTVHRISVAPNIGDPEKYAQRVYEVVSGIGLAKDFVARPTSSGEWDGPWSLNSVPIGTDCYAALKRHHGILGENLSVFEAFAQLTDVDEGQVQYFSHI